MFRFFGILLLNLFFISLSSSLKIIDDTKKVDQGQRYRLPNTTVPMTYTLILKIDPNKDRFQGHTFIQIKCKADTDKVVIHTKNLNITRAIVKSSLGPIDVLKTNHTNDDRDFYTMILKNTLVKNHVYELEFEYDAPYDKESNGLHRKFYLNRNGRNISLVTTHLQPIFSRRVYPCYDEPALKAKFHIHIYAPKGYHSVSNMDVIASNMIPMKDYDLTSFRSTPPMSTYVVAILVSDFEYISNIRDGETITPKEFKIYSKPADKLGLEFALNIGQRCFNSLRNYTDVEYGLPKIDVAAVPDYESGAFEGWGLILYNEKNLVKFDGSITSFDKMRISTYLSHELAHYWFGNEVTPSWWDYLWLSEGFCSFFQLYNTDKVFDGKWRLMEEFVVNGLQDIMEHDSRPTVESMSSEVNSPKEIMTKFATISYNKSACVIRMMQHVLGEPLLQKSLSSYLKNLLNNVTDQDIFFSEIQKVVGPAKVLPNNATVEDVFGSWSEQPGYPIIYVSKLDNSTIQIKQERYLMSKKITSFQRWWIPLTWATSNNPSFDNTTTQSWMSPDDDTLTIPIEPSTKWIIFNKQHCGYYRVMYSEDMWKDIIKVLNSDDHKLIHPLNKAQLLNDAGAFSRQDRLSHNITFDLLNYLSKETDWIPWIRADLTLLYLKNRMPEAKIRRLLKSFIASKVEKAYESVGLTANHDDGYVIRRKRYLISRIACDNGVISCLKAAEEILEKSLQPKPEPLDHDLESLIYCSGLRRGSESLWKNTLKKYEITSSERERNMILHGLGCSLNGSIIDAYLNMAISDKSVLRPKDKTKVIYTVMNSGSFSTERLSKFFYDNYLIFKKIFSTSLIDDLIYYTGTFTTTNKNIPTFKEFVEKHSSHFEEYEKKLVIEVNGDIDKMNKWRNIHLPSIEAWLEDNVIDLNL